MHLFERVLEASTVLFVPTIVLLFQEYFLISHRQIERIDHLEPIGILGVHDILAYITFHVSSQRRPQQEVVEDADRRRQLHVWVFVGVLVLYTMIHE